MRLEKAPGPASGSTPAPSESKPTLNAATLASLPVDQQKRLLGENLFGLIQSHAPPQYVGKVTGMLLEMDNAELLHLMETPEDLKERVDDAIEAISAAMAAAKAEE